MGTVAPTAQSGMLQAAGVDYAFLSPAGHPGSLPVWGFAPGVVGGPC